MINQQSNQSAANFSYLFNLNRPITLDFNLFDNPHSIHCFVRIFCQIVTIIIIWVFPRHLKVTHLLSYSKKSCLIIIVKNANFINFFVKNWFNHFYHKCFILFFLNACEFFLFSLFNHHCIQIVEHMVYLWF